MATAINDIVTTIGLDLGKNVFHIVGMNARGAVVLRERLSRAKLTRRQHDIMPDRHGRKIPLAMRGRSID
jgi:hypothetical protein